MTVPLSEDLRRRADAAGIEAGYWDALGSRRDLDDETATAVLRAMGVPLSGDATESAGVGGRALPPAWIVRTDGESADAGPIVEVPIAEGAASQALDWVLELESGPVIEGSSVSSPDVIGADDGRERLPIDFGIRIPLGYHRLHFDDRSASLTLIVAPRRCWIPPELLGGERCWGLSIQLYALRSSRNWGVGDFSDLAQCARIAGSAGAALVGLNPLHARHLARPDAASPYWPSSRLFLDVVYIDVEAVEEFAQCPEAIDVVATEEFRDALQRARDAVLVDYPGVTALKLRILRLLHRTFSETSAHAASPNATFALFQKRHGAALVRFAEFEALRLTRLLRDGWVASWRDWPDEWRDPDSAAMARFRIESANEIEFQMYLQWQAEQQLDRAAAIAREAGLRLALYRDLAVGAADDSAESWGDQRLVASGASIGAPPDLFARDGQNWGLPPMNPRVLAERAYKPLADLLAANMRGAGALRIDHVMALQRLFWIPSGMPGTRGCYVNNPFDALTAIVALESVRQRSMVIGEDLGSVPDGLRERLHDLGLLSYRVLIFERHWHGDGSFKRPWHYPAQSLATVATHDMPTIADFWQGSDIERRARLGLYQEPALHAQAVERREAERRGILSLLAELGLTPPDSSSAAQVAEALHAVIARTPAMLAVVQLDDVVGEIEPVNIPGTTSEYPNWRRKTSLPIEELGEHDGLRRIGSMMKEAGRI